MRWSWVSFIYKYKTDTNFVNYMYFKNMLYVFIDGEYKIFKEYNK